MNSINKKEIEKFSKIAEEWWNPNGKFKPLHNFNPIRIKYIKENIIKDFKIKYLERPLKKINLLDIGCGGGLLSEPMCSISTTKKVTIPISPKNHFSRYKKAAKCGTDAILKLSYESIIAKKKKKHK